VNLYPTSGRIVLDKRGPNYQSPPICYDERFRLSVKRVSASRELEIGDTDPARGAYTVGIEVAWDPELQPLYLETRPHGVLLKDDKNRVIKVPDDGSEFASVDGRIAYGIEVRLPVLPRSVEKISSLEGELSMIEPSQMLTFNFETLGKLKETSVNDPERRLTRGNVTCHLSKVTLAEDHWTIQVTLDYPPRTKQLDSNQSWVVNNEMTLESRFGKQRISSSEYALESATPRRAVLSYHFRDKDLLKRNKPGDWKLSYRTPADVIAVPIKFAFKGIPLP
jgi:hypothetical protein